jgi:solute carrier family 25 citrate transporter 1
MSSSPTATPPTATAKATTTTPVATSAPAKKKKHPVQHLIAGGCAGFVESSVCHPLDTIKTRMQLRKNQSDSVQKVVVKMRNSLVEPALRLKHSLQEPHLAFRTAATEPGLHLSPATHAAATTATTIQESTMLKHTVSAPLGPIGTARRIVEREGFLALYKGLTAVYTGIIPKMAIRFVAFEQYREWLTALNSGQLTTTITFTAGLASGLTEAVLVVTPSEVCKVRMMGQYHSLQDPVQKQHRKYTNVVQTGYTIIKEEGIGALYKGVVPTMLRQGCNQAVNFTAYNWIKTKIMDWQQTDQLQHWQSLTIGGLSGGMGPLVNNPLDVVKTRLQKQIITPGKTPKYTGMVQCMVVIAKEEGPTALWKGIVPRLLRIMPGQAITFMTYEAVTSQMNRLGWFEKQ